MKATTVKFTKHVGNKGIYLTLRIVLLFVFFGGCDGYSMEDYCSEIFSSIWKNEYQIMLELNDNKIYGAKDEHYPYNRLGYCHTTFEAWNTEYPKLMFYFEDLNLGCDKGHLEFYIGAKSFKNITSIVGESNDTRLTGLEGDICGANKPQGVFAVDEKGFRIKYIPKRNQYITHIFSIIVTSYRGKKACPRHAYRCDNFRCIDDALACNGYDSCGDGSGCELSMRRAIVLIVLGSLFGIIVSVFICCRICKRRRSGNSRGAVQSTPMCPYPVATATIIAATSSIYGCNQDTNYPNNQEPYPNVASNINQQVPHVDNYKAPPPQYNELFATSEEKKQQP